MRPAPRSAFSSTAVPALGTARPQPEARAQAATCGDSTGGTGEATAWLLTAGLALLLGRRRRGWRRTLEARLARPHYAR